MRDTQFKTVPEPPIPINTILGPVFYCTVPTTRTLRLQVSHRERVSLAEWYFKQLASTYSKFLNRQTYRHFSAAVSANQSTCSRMILFPTSKF